MLNSIDLDDKTYQEYLQEALSQIPLYSNEWTNFNISDPGIMVLENFAAFHELQMKSMNDVPEEVTRSFLKLLGITEGINIPSVLPVKVQGNGKTMTLPTQKKFTLGSLVFETVKENKLSDMEVKAAYTKTSDKYTDITYILDRDVKISTGVFGNEPKKGNMLYLIVNKIEKPKTRIFFGIDDKFNRNPFQGSSIEFAKIKAEIFTANGWEQVNYIDMTNSFLSNGEVILSTEGIVPIMFDETPVQGYAIRFVLEDNNYDVSPKLSCVDAELIALLQENSLSRAYYFDGEEEVRVHSELLYHNYAFVYVLEEDGFYHEYNEVPEGSLASGRCYVKKMLSEDEALFIFDKEEYGYGPMNVKRAVCVLCYTEGMVFNKKLGPVYDYENQEFDVNQVKNLISGDFSLVLEHTISGGEKAYEIVYPSRRTSRGFLYTLDEKNGTVKVVNSGSYENGMLFVGQAVVTDGANVNVRSNTTLKPVHNKEGFNYTNPDKSKGGTSYETTEDMKKKFVHSMKQKDIAVTAKDYEKLILRTPGLCIHKVSVFAGEEENVVVAAVKPRNEERFPELSGIYRREIEEFLQTRRMMTTRVRLTSPQYIPITVQGTIYINGKFSGAKEIIEDVLKEELDYINSDHSFGDIISFKDVYRKIEQLPCVEFIYELKIKPNSSNGATIVGSDIRLGKDCLAYAGQINLELLIKQ